MKIFPPASFFSCRTVPQKAGKTTTKTTRATTRDAQSFSPARPALQIASGGAASMKSSGYTPVLTKEQFSADLPFPSEQGMVAPPIVPRPLGYCACRTKTSEGERSASSIRKTLSPKTKGAGHGSSSDVARRPVLVRCLAEQLQTL